MAIVQRCLQAASTTVSVTAQVAWIGVVIGGHSLGAGIATRFLTKQALIFSLGREETSNRKRIRQISDKVSNIFTLLAMVAGVGCAIYMCKQHRTLNIGAVRRQMVNANLKARMEEIFPHVFKPPGGTS